jgi:hypothetical protein
MSERETIQEQIDGLTGKLAVLGMALQAALKYHPNRQEVAALIHENYEVILSKALYNGFPEKFVLGMQRARELYVLNDPPDPGQPSNK